MRFDINVSGRPAEVRAQLQQQAQTARRDDSDSAAVVGAISDAISRKLTAVADDESITVKGSFELEVTGSDSAMKVLADRADATRSNPLAPATPIPSPLAEAAATEGARSVPVSERPDIAAAESALNIPPAKRRASDQPTIELK